MPQFDTKGSTDVGGAISRAMGMSAAKGASPYSPVVKPMSGAAKVSADAKAKMVKENKSNPNKLAYWMRKTGGRKNAAYTMLKRQKQGQRRGTV
jgi:hypothetical protein